MRKLIGTIVILFGIMLAPTAEAQIMAGNVSRLYVTAGGTVNFRITNACKSATYFYFSISSDHGKAWYAMLLSAAANRQQVRVSISDTCDPDNNQAVAYIFQDYE